MAFRDVYFDYKFAYGWSGGPEGHTRIRDLRNRAEDRNAQWDQPRHRWVLPYDHIDYQVYRAIKQMHMNMRFRKDAFRFRDPLDHYADGEVFGTGTGSPQEYQLATVSSIGGVSYAMEVYALPSESVLDDFAMTVAGTPSGIYTLDRNRGTITVNATIGAELAWSGTFDHWVRFAQDWMPFSADDPDAVNGSVELIEVTRPRVGEI